MRRTAGHPPGFVVQLEQALDAGGCRRVTVATSLTLPPTLPPPLSLPPPPTLTVLAAPSPQTALSMDMRRGRGGARVAILQLVAESRSSRRKVHGRRLNPANWKLMILRNTIRARNVDACYDVGSIFWLKRFLHDGAP